MRLRLSWRGIRDWFKHLLHLDDSAKRIALGAAVGVFVAATPTLGFQMLLVLLLLIVIPGNRLAGLPLVWITNPATAVPIYYFNYRLGAWLTGRHASEAIREHWRQVIDRLPATSIALEAPVEWMGQLWQWLGVFWRAMAGVVVPLWVGSLVVGVVAGGLAYVVMYYLVVFFRQRLLARLHRMAELRQARHERRVAREEARKAARARRKDESEP